MSDDACVIVTFFCKENNQGLRSYDLVTDCEADSLEGALLGAKTLVEEGTECDYITIKCKPGYRWVDGELLYSAQWL